MALCEGGRSLTPCTRLLLCVGSRAEAIHVQRAVDNGALPAPALAHLGLRVCSLDEGRPLGYGSNAAPWDGACVHTKRSDRDHLEYRQHQGQHDREEPSAIELRVRDCVRRCNRLTGLVLILDRLPIALIINLLGFFFSAEYTVLTAKPHRPGRSLLSRCLPGDKDGRGTTLRVDRVLINQADLCED